MKSNSLSTLIWTQMSEWWKSIGGSGNGTKRSHWQYACGQMTYSCSWRSWAWPCRTGILSSASLLSRSRLLSKRSRALVKDDFFTESLHSPEVIVCTCRILQNRRIAWTLAAVSQSRLRYMLGSDKLPINFKKTVLLSTKNLGCADCLLRAERTELMVSKEWVLCSLSKFNPRRLISASSLLDHARILTAYLLSQLKKHPSRNCVSLPSSCHICIAGLCCRGLLHGRGAGWQADKLHRKGRLHLRGKKQT